MSIREEKLFRRALAIFIFTICITLFSFTTMIVKVITSPTNIKVEEPQEIIIKVVVEHIYEKDEDVKLTTKTEAEPKQEPKKETKKISEKKVKTKQVSSRGDSRTFEATAYTDDVQSQGKWVGQTASGMKPQVGVIAVDPKVIPLGTKLIVEGYNNNDICIAGDTGGAIKGKRLDLFFNTRKEALAFGRRNVKVTIVE